MRKITIFILAILMVISLFAACSDSSEKGTGSVTTNKGAETEEAAETEPLDPLEARKLVSDELPEWDFQGSTFKIVCEDDQLSHYTSEEITGDVVNDAIYERNAAIGERFNVNIVVQFHGDYGAVGSNITKVVLAGDDEIDLIAHHVVNAGKLALSEVYMNWGEVPYVDFSKPWWSISTTEDLTYNGVTLLAVGDVSLGSIGRTYCVFFDKVKAADYDIPDMYDLVWSGAWTIDKLSEITRDIYIDVNGNDVRDFDDFYGFATGSNSNLGAYLWAFDNPVMKKDSTGTPVLSVKTEKMNSMVEKLCDMYYLNTGTFADKSYVSTLDAYGAGHTTGRDMFYYGNTIFTNGYIDMAIDTFREVENDYGIIPYPKWNEQQERYRLLVDGNFAALAIPKSAADLDKAGIITEALCAESYKSVVPAYYDVALKVKFTRDTESVEMLDLLMESRMFDFGYIYDGWNGCSFVLEDLVKNNNTNFESRYAKDETKITTHFGKVIELFESYMD